MTDTRTSLSEQGIRALIVADAKEDVLFIHDTLAAGGIDVHFRRAADAISLRSALQDEQWDVVISDDQTRNLTAHAALRIVRARSADLPFLLFANAIGEERAVGLMRAGACDVVAKDHPARLLPAVRREIQQGAAQKRRRDAENTIRELNERLHVTVERAPVGIVNVDLQGFFIHANPRFCEMVGYTRDELISLRFSDITHPDDSARDVAGQERMLHGELVEYQTEKRYIRKDGEILWVSLTSALVRDPLGNHLYFASIMLDITEKKQMACALREQDQRYRLIVDTAQEGIWTVGADERTTFVNRTMAAMLGYSAEEMIGRTVYDFMDARHVGRALQYARLHIGGVSGEDDFVLKHKGGERVRVHFAANALRAEDGTHLGTVAMVADVTARWNAEQTVRQQKIRMEEAQRIAHLGSWTRSLSSPVIEWSDELFRIFGYEPGSVVPTMDLVMAAIVAEDRDDARAIMAQATERGTTYENEYRIDRPDGSRRVVHTYGEIRLGQHGTPGEMFGVTQDVTERVAAATTHGNLDRHIKMLLQSTTQGIFGLDLDGRCTFINRAASEVLGYLPEELVGAPMHETIHHSYADGSPYPKSKCPAETVMRTGKSWDTHDDTLWRRDGTPVPVEYAAAPINDRGMTLGTVIVFTDTSERKLLQLQLEQGDRLSSLGRLAATIAHEFNNVLMSIQPFAEMLSRHDPTETVQRSTRHILRAVERGRRITQEILNFTKPSELLPETFDAAIWLHSVEGALTAMVGSSIHVDVRIHGERLLVSGDPHQLEQVLTNLAANARDAMGNGGHLDILAERCAGGRTFPFGTLRTVDKYLHLQVTDTGCGMDAMTLKHVFEPFYTSKRTGNGLGLAVAHQIVQLHGGSIIAESRLGSGTSFHLFLPLAEEALNDPAGTLMAGYADVDPLAVLERHEALARTSTAHGNH